MNTKGNQRYQNTKNRIKGEFLNLLEEGERNVTVRQICERAQIHRTTFYGHYEDINALLNELIIEMYFQLMDFFLPEGQEFDENGFLKTFELLQENRTFFLYYFSQIRAEQPMEISLPEPMLKNMSKLMKQMQLESEEELRYQYMFFASGTVAVMIRWLNGGCKETPEEMCRLMKKNFESFYL